MRKKTTIFTILLALLLGLNPLTAKHAANPLPTPAPDGTFCAAPAPTNISWGFPSPTNIVVSWSTVVSVWGYQATLTSSFGTQTYTGVNNTASFAVIPGNTYIFEVKSMCGPQSVSIYSTKATISTNIIIMDVITDLSAPACNGRLTIVHDMDPNTPQAIEFVPEPNVNYYLQFNKNGNNYTTLYTQTVNGNTPAGHIQKVDGNPGVLSCNSMNSPGSCTSAAYAAGTGSSSDAGAVIQVFQVVSSSIYDQILISPYDNHPQFDAFGLFTCTGGGGFGGDGKDRNDNNSASNTASYIVSPFHDFLKIGFGPEHKSLKSIRLLDISGRVLIDHNLPEDLDIPEQYLLPTTDIMSGLYILQIQSADGFTETHKVVKE